MSATQIMAKPAPRRGLSCPEAADYVGISPTKFMLLVAAGRMPKPVRIDRRVIWDIRELDRAFDALSEEQQEVSVDSAWDDVTP